METAARRPNRQISGRVESNINSMVWRSAWLIGCDRLTARVERTASRYDTMLCIYYSCQKLTGPLLRCIYKLRSIILLSDKRNTGMRYVGCILLRTDISATMRPNGVEVCTIELRPETSFSPFVGNILAVSSGEYRGSRRYGHTPCSLCIRHWDVGLTSQLCRC